MPASLRSLTTATSPSTSYSINKPTGVTAGDVLILVQFADAGSTSNMTTPSGWTQLLSVSSGSGNLHGKMWVKTAGGSEPSSYSLAQGFGSDGVAQLWAIRDGLAPASAASSTSGFGTSITTPGITPTGTNDLEIRWAACNGDSANRTLTPAAGFTEPPGADLNSGGYTTVGGAYRLLASSSATSSANWTASGSILSGTRMGFTVAVAAAFETVVRSRVFVPRTAVHRASRI